MSANTKLTVSPHIHSGMSTGGIMLDVLIALLPATVAAVVIFGLSSLWVVLTCVASCVIFEALFCLITKKAQTVKDLSAAVTGLLLALNLPNTTPLWQCVVGALFAIIVVKCLFGGLGQNLVNPAITARVFMLVAFSSTVSRAVFPVDAVAGSTPLVPEAEMPGLLELATGYRGTSAIGETCIIALLIGGIYLMVRRVITWHNPVAFMGTVFLFGLCANGFDPVYALSYTMCGGVVLGAIFMATDYVTSPPTAWGKILFGIGCGLITCLIRQFSGEMHEGVSYAILFMNILNPYICQWTRHKVFGAGGAKK